MWEAHSVRRFLILDVLRRHQGYRGTECPSHILKITLLAILRQSYYLGIRL